MIHSVILVSSPLACFLHKIHIVSCVSTINNYLPLIFSPNNTGAESDRAHEYVVNCLTL